jgi:hypothetical protein
MCLKNWCASFMLLSLTGACVAGTSVVPTTTLAAQTTNNTSAANTFKSQTNGNAAPGNVSRGDVHTLLYSGSTTKVYAHLLLWFGGSNHMNVGYSSTDPNQVHRQVSDMIARGIDGVIIDWYGQNNTMDQATKLVMAEAELHPGFTFAIMIDQGAIQWYSCSGCSPQQALVSDLLYLQQTYFTSPAYMTLQGQPVVTNFNIDLSYSVDWNAASAALATPPAFVFQNNTGFTHVLSDGSYSWVMPTTTDYGMSYLASFYDAGMPLQNEETVGASYKGFNDSLASWGSNRIMGQQCAQTWLQTFSKANGLYNSGKQLPALQLVTWNDYEEGTEIESGINNCFSVSASASGNSLRWTVKGSESTVDHYVAYISTDGQNLMSLGNSNPGTSSLNLCSFSLSNGKYTAYVQAVGKPSITNQMSGAVKVMLSCPSASSDASLAIGASPSSLDISPGGSGKLTVTVVPSGGEFNTAVALACAGLPTNLSCSFSPASVTPGANSATSVLTLVAAPVTTADHHERTSPLLGMWVFGFGLFGTTLIGKFQRKQIVLMFGVCVLAGLIVGGTSCGGSSMSAVKTGTPSSTSTPTAANSYVVAVNGIAGSIQLSTNVVINVK